MATTEESSSTAKAGLTTGIIGTALAGLLALNNSNGNGLLGGLFGGGNSNTALQAAGNLYTDQLQAKIAEMNAEKYSNNVALEVYKAARAQDAILTSKFESLASEIADSKVREATLRGEIATNNATVQGQIAQVASNATNGINVLNAALTCLQNTVSGITATYVPSAKVTPQPMNLYNSWTAPTTTTTTT